MVTTYSLGCCDAHGNSINDRIPVGSRQNRVFKPTTDPRYATTVNLPSLITVYNTGLQITHLTLGDQYKPTPSDKIFTNGNVHIQPDTMVIEAGAKKRGDMVIGARSFGQASGYNRRSIPKPNDPLAKATAATIDIGCQNAIGIVEKHPFIKKVIFMTSEKAIYEGVEKIWDWFEDGFPTTFAGELEKIDFLFLHNNISALEAKGVEVLFWLVNPEYIVGPNFVADNFFDELADIAVNTIAPCKCSDCIVKTQHHELLFAQTGEKTCSCEHCGLLLKKYAHLKKGETFPLTNNANLDVQVTMQADSKLSVKDYPPAAGAEGPSKNDENTPFEQSPMGTTAKEA